LRAELPGKKDRYVPFEWRQGGSPASPADNGT
jgi:hypothetical protein